MVGDKLLITGGSGMLGSNLVKSTEDRFNVHAVYYKHPVNFKACQVHQLDITKREDTIKLVSNINPDYIIHTAALIDVDYCETHRDEAWKLNIEGTRNLVEAAEKTGSRIFYISTDSVFDGKKGMYTEEDKPNPLNFYALTKLRGERVVSKSHVPYTIIRTNIYGWNVQEKLSIAEWMLSNLQENKKLTLFSDVFFSPMLANNLSEIIIEMVEMNLSGLFHVAGSERCSKLQFGLMLAKVFGLNKELIKPISLEDKKLVAKRPKDPSLSSEKVQKQVRTKLLNVKEGLEAFKSLRDTGYVKELKRCLL